VASPGAYPRDKTITSFDELGSLTCVIVVSWGCYSMELAKWSYIVPPRARVSLSKSSAGTIEILQLGRALAAIAVIFTHVVRPTEAVVERVPHSVAWLLDLGYLGVDFFFILSGFIIYYTNAQRYQKPGWTKSFLDSRLKRIYLPYLPIAVGLGLLHTFLPGQRMGGDPWNWFATLTLMPIGAKSVLGISWSLTYELAFYGLALLFFRSRDPLAWAAVWAIAIVLWQVVAGSFGSPPPLSLASIFLNPINLEFIFGIFAAWAVMRGEPHRASVFWFGAIMSIAAFFIDGMNRDHSWMVGLGLALILVPIVRAEQAGRIRVSAPSLLLGNASYAIYLIHPPVLTFTSRVVGRLPMIDSWKLSVLVGVFASIAAGLAFHILYERPVLKLFTHKTLSTTVHVPSSRLSPTEPNQAGAAQVPLMSHRPQSDL
jgi:exopolysaccharide production protein ExoZ